MRFTSFLFLLLPFTAIAQKEDTAKHKLSIALSDDYKTGNYELRSASSSVFYSMIIGKRELSVMPTYKYTKTFTNGVWKENENEFYSCVSYEEKYERKKVIFFTEEEHSLLRKINFRGNLGIGYGYTLFETKRMVLKLSEVVLPEIYEGVKHDYDNRSLKASTRIKFLYADSILNISSITLIQPSIYNTKDINQGENFTFKSSNSIFFHLYKMVAIGVTEDLIVQNYAHYINKSVKEYDSHTTIFLKLNF